PISMKATGGRGGEAEAGDMAMRVVEGRRHPSAPAAATHSANGSQPGGFGQRGRLWPGSGESSAAAAGGCGPANAPPPGAFQALAPPRAGPVPASADIRLKGLEL